MKTLLAAPTKAQNLLPDAARTKILKDLQALVDLPTVSIRHDIARPSQALLAPFNDTVNYLEKRALEEGKTRGSPFHITRLVSAARPNLIIGTHQTKTPDLALLIHLDVVPPHFPFAMDPGGETARGRGVVDMKYAAAASLNLLADLSSSQEAISVSFIFTSDEEVGGEHGAQFLYKRGYRPKFMIVPDGDSSNPWAISRTCKGLWHFRIEGVPGKSGHAAHPWLGDNSVRKARDFDAKLHALYPDPVKETPGVSTINLADMGVSRHLDVKHNNIPDSAFMVYDGRFHSQEAMDNFTKTLTAMVDQELPGASIETDVRYNFYRADLEHPDAKLFCELLKDAFGEEPKLLDNPSNTDAVHFYTTPSLITKVAGGGAHGKEERVNIDSILAFKSLLTAFIDIKNDRRQMEHNQN